MIYVALITIIGTLQLTAGTCPFQVLDHGVANILNGDCTSFTETGQCTVNTTLLYHCTAFNLIGDSVVRCIDENTWYPPVGVCTPEQDASDLNGYCPDPTPVNGRILSTTMPSLSDGTYAVGTEAQLACNTGYTIFGTYPSVCTQPGIWIPRAFECIPDDDAWCSVPSTPPLLFIWHIGEEPDPGCFQTICPIKTNSIIYYLCDPEYYLVGHGSSFCRGYGQWNLPVPTCEVTCADPSPTNGQVTPTGLNNGRYRINTIVSFTCDIGYGLTGDHLESTCQTSGSWNPQPPSCLGVSCRALKMLENGQVSYSESPMTGGRYPVNTMATFTCNHGYILDGSQTRTCQPSLEWSQQTPICNRVTCAELMLTNGEITYNQSKVNGRYPVDTKATFSCNDRYRIDGSISSTCQTSGEWNQLTPTCNLITCPAPPSLSNGVIHFQYGSKLNGGYTVPTLATYRCNDGFSISGDIVQILCYPSGEWSHDFPTCEEDC